MFDTRKNKDAKREGKPGGKMRRLTCLLLCVCMVISVFPVLRGALSANAYDAAPTEHIVADSRVADPNTMDDYLKQLLSTDWGSRYAGRVWTDKSVFAYGSSGTDWDGTQLTLDMTTDGYNGGVGFDADFGHVFSALASSQVINEYPPSPIDLVIVFDMSASMGQDTRYGLDVGLNMYQAHDNANDGKTEWPEAGVPMDDRIQNSRIQKTLDAINSTIDNLMAQNPQNRVAVCGYGANAVVLMPLGHYRKTGDTPYLTVGGMETLYHPSDLVYRQVGDDVKKAGTPLPAVDADGWYWMNNRDTCYTVVVNAEYNTYTGVLDDRSEASQTWETIENFTVSNNVLTDDGTNVKAFPGDWENGEPTDKFAEQNKEVYEHTSSGDGQYAAGIPGVLNSKDEQGNDLTDENGIRTSHLKEAMKRTSGLKADDYVGYFTNTQGGIYLAYKQLADSTATTYTEKLTNGVLSTVARIPAAIIMSDGGANFSFNEMGWGDDKLYTADDWNVRYGQRVYENGAATYGYLEDNTWTKDHTPKWIEHDGKAKDGRELTDGRPIDVRHRLDGIPSDGNERDGNEWYKVFIPGEDTLEGWDGLHGLYNQGADITEDGTLTSPPSWSNAGVFYNSDNSPVDAPGTILEVLLTAAYMHDIVKTHYNNGWTLNGVTEESKSDLLTYTMNVDTEHVPQWGKMRLFPTLDPKDYPLDTIQSEKWYKKTEQFGDENLADDRTLTEVYEDLYKSWSEWKSSGATQATIANENSAKVTINSIASAGADAADYATKLTTKDGKTQDDTIHVTDENVIANIAYNDGFFDVTSENLDTTFDNILALIMGNVFVPVSGDNDAGVGDSVTYQDPLGAYMEVKNQAVEAQTHKDAEAEKDAGTYDMSLLLFGRMHGLVRAGTYDWQWNDTYMSSHGLDVGNVAFPMGWYHGDDPTTAQKAGTEPDCAVGVKYDDSGTYPANSIDGKTAYANAEQAWADGWAYRFDFKTLLQFVPITAEVASDVHPSDLPAQIKNTVYTCYRFAGSRTERNALHRNPVFGDVPADLQAKWDALGGSYPDDDALYRDVPGVYRLSDIRVWVEDTGTYTDTEGVIVPNQGYERSLYLNIPAAAVPTQLATVTLGRDGVLSYLTNLATDKGIDYDALRATPEAERTDEDAEKLRQYEAYSAQSTPLRLFYAVGLEDDLILRDDEGAQIGVDFTKISPEYMAAHSTESENGEVQNYIWFISNFYSETNYTDYVTDTAAARTRGDPTVTFSPSADNRYYVFQKPLPLYAHAYRQVDGALRAVDYADGNWSEADKPTGGNGETTWENGATGGTWTGGEYMGTYKNAATFAEAKQKALADGDADGYYRITDDHGTTYVYFDDGIVFFEDDALDHVRSNPDNEDGSSGGYTDDSISFASDDYFFLLVEYYLPEGEIGSGVDDQGKTVPGSYGGRMIQRVVARRGSEFGSGFASENIGNGDMLCWTDMNGRITVELDYQSKSTTGDLTRGEPTYEKLTQTGENLREYLRDTCGIGESVLLPDPDDPEKTVSALDWQVDYWTKAQADPGVRSALEDAKKGDELTRDEFDEAFRFVVSARPGGIRSGDMSNNRHAKSENTTRTANNYYVPTVSGNSGTNDEVILNTYLGNNGYLAIANQMLHVTKLVEPPAGFSLSKAQEEETFNYQIYVQGLTGTRSAVRTRYNVYAGSWERELAYIDVLTDNSDLVLDNSSNRALFVKNTVAGTEGATLTAKQVIANGQDEDGSTRYYEANEDGTLPTTESGDVDETKRVVIDADNPLYYLYLPSNGTSANAQHTRRLYQNQDYDGTADGYAGTNFIKNGTTTFYAPGQRTEGDTGTKPGVGNNDSYRETNDLKKRPAGTITYWAQDAELIPVEEVLDAETVLGDASGGSEAYALESVASTPMWTHENGDHDAHVELKFFTLVIRKPSGETSMTAFESPFQTRSQYMTVTLEFGRNANMDVVPDGAEAENRIGEAISAEDDLYDRILPSADRPDLFAGKTLAQVAANTAEFTLKHGEGLLLSGLDNRIAYRFTEKLTAEQLAKGYTLKRISHIQQLGSESVYKPGVQEIPVYTMTGATYGEAYGAAADYLTENGLTWEREGATRTLEPFAHTNAVLWTYYATMETGASGNHHQPQGVTEAAEQEKSVTVWNQHDANTYTTVGGPRSVADNPNCTALDPNDLANSGCDVVREDGTTLHYMYYDGVLLDPHYEGEASTYLRNMARYGVSPTVHFGVNGETQKGTETVPAASPADGYYDYDGVYSVYGNTGWFEEQANFVNTWTPDALTVSKALVGENAKTTLNERDKNVEFHYTVTFVLPGWLSGAEAANMLQALPYWKGKTADRDKTTAEGGAPRPSALAEIESLAKTHAERGEAETLSPDASGTYAFDLKADESVVLYGLPIGTTYTVEETRDPKYPLQGEVEGDPPYKVTGTVEKSEVGSVVASRVTYTNEKPEPEVGTLTVEKRITDDDAWEAGKAFTFTVTLTPPDDADFAPDMLTVERVKKAEDGSETVESVPSEELWKGPEGKTYTATFTLQHGERLVIDGVPLGTDYTVTETDRDGYYLEYVVDAVATPDTTDPHNFIHPDGYGVSGTIGETANTAYWLFANAKPADLPFSGGFGVGTFYVCGAVVIVAAAAVLLGRRFRRGKRVM